MVKYKVLKCYILNFSCILVSCSLRISFYSNNFFIVSLSVYVYLNSKIWLYNFGIVKSLSNKINSVCFLFMYVLAIILCLYFCLIEFSISLLKVDSIIYWIEKFGPISFLWTPTLSFILSLKPNFITFSSTNAK